MKIELFTVCDFAADYAGKLTVVGSFDCLNARQVPFAHHHFCVAVKMRFEKIEEGRKQLRFSLSDADGHAVIAPMEMLIDVKMPGDILSLPMNIIASVGGMKFARFGEYSVDLAINGRLEASTPLFVRHIS